MPTPIECFLREEKDGDARRQLGASQEWDWAQGIFRGFVDRDEYLRSVRAQLIRYQALQISIGRFQAPSGSTKNPSPVHSYNSEDRRMAQLLLYLQSSLQSRRIKSKMLREQQIHDPFHRLVAIASQESILLSQAFSKSPGHVAAFCTQASAQSLRRTFKLPPESNPEKIFSIDLDPQAHRYDRWKTQNHFQNEPPSRKFHKWTSLERWIKGISSQSSQLASSMSTTASSCAAGDLQTNNKSEQINNPSFFPKWINQAPTDRFGAPKIISQPASKEDRRR